MNTRRALPELDRLDASCRELRRRLLRMLRALIICEDQRSDLLESLAADGGPDEAHRRLDAALTARRAADDLTKMLVDVERIQMSIDDLCFPRHLGTDGRSHDDSARMLRLPDHQPNR